MPLVPLLRRLRPPSPAELDAVRSYRRHLDEALARAQAVRDGWLEVVNAEHEDERLANRAAVYRWELLQLGQQLDEVAPPRLASAVHRDLRRLLKDAARACQLLATGTRFHKSETVCDGQTLLVESVAALDPLSRQLDAIAPRG